MHITLGMSDLLVRKVAVLVDEEQVPGYHEVTFDAASLASGVYVYRMTAGTCSATKKLVLMRG
jgi:hypothetical protein